MWIHKLCAHALMYAKFLLCSTSSASRADKVITEFRNCFNFSFPVQMGGVNGNLCHVPQKKLKLS